MRPLMCRQVVRSGEDLTADAACVGFHACMQTHMPRQHVGPCEGTLANVAQVSFGRIGLVLVAIFMPRSHMLGESVVQAEHLAADGTHVGDVGAGWHFFDDRRHVEVVPDGDRFFGRWRRDVTFDDVDGHVALGMDEASEDGWWLLRGGGCQRKISRSTR